MRFKNATIFRLEPSWSGDLAECEDALQTFSYAPASASAESAAGWVPPRGGKNDAMLESVGGQWLLTYLIETKSVPGATLRREVDRMAADIERTTGRAPGKKERKALKEDALSALLPQAFSRFARVNVWIDRANYRLVLDTVSASRADTVVTALVQCLSGFAVAALHTKLEPASAMSGWLALQMPPVGFDIDRECELKAFESKAVVKYGRHPLDIDEVRGHIEAGKRPTKLALTWEDRVSFVLTDGFTLRKLVFLEGTLYADKAVDNFEADAAITTGELGQMLPALIEGLGGEMKMGQAT